MRLSAVLTIIAAILFVVIPASAQSAPPPTTTDVLGAGAQIACLAYPQSTQSFKRKLWDGYEISLGPTPNPLDAGNNCTAAIYNAQTKVVYRTTGFNVTFDQNLTGKDFDGDGHSEVVFQTDTGGGNHCCWEYNVISLYPKPHKLFDIAQEGAVWFEWDSQGKVAVWQDVEAPDAFNSSMASRPFANRVSRVRDEKLVDATPEFCDRIFAPGSREVKRWSAELSPENIARLQAAGKPEDEENTASALLERAYQHVLCRQNDAALADLNLWPASSRAQMKSDFAKQISDDFPAFAATLVQPPASK